MQYNYLTLRKSAVQVTLNVTIMVMLTIFYDLGFLETLMAICIMVAGGLFLENLEEGLKKNGYRVFYNAPLSNVRVLGLGILVFLTLCYVTGIPYSEDVFTYSMGVGLVSVVSFEGLTRLKKRTNIEFSVLKQDGDWYKMVTNDRRPESVALVEEFNSRKITGHEVMVEALNTIVKGIPNGHIQVHLPSDILK